MGIKTVIKELPIPALSSGLQHIVIYPAVGGVRLSESSLKDFLPVMGISLINKSTNEIKVMLNDTDDNAFRVPGNSSRTLTGVPAYDITVQNVGSTSTTPGQVYITLFNDVEQVGRWNSYAKRV